MKKILILTCFLLFQLTLICQDSYHSQLESTFQADNLPIGQWVFFDNETANMDASTNYGGSFSIIESTGTDFSKLARAIIANAGANQWDAGWTLRNQQKINAGDKVLMVFSIRSVGGTGKVNIFAENSTTFDKEVFLNVDISEDWIQFVVPFESSSTFNPNSMTHGFHLAHQVQTIEIGGFTAMNFGKNVALSDLPNEVNNDKYEGYAADAPWRAAAAERIENLRKANLNIQVKNTDGMAVEGAKIEIKMLRHDFAFGSAINANKIAGNNAQNNIYESKITNLDGKGHGFNWVVFENDMKWPAWEDHWFVSQPELANAVQWLKARNIEIRGHNLVWPGEGNMPSDINQNKSNISYLKDRIDQHLKSILTYPNMEGEIAEWDVLNEITTNRSLENYFRGKEGYTTGREILAEIFKKTRELDPNTGLWLNDYVTISTNSQPGNENYDNLKAFTRELLDAGVDLEGIGFQGHIGGFPNGIPSVLETLDDFHNEFGLKAKITEFDMPTFVNADLAAQYLGDFLTATFSHESMDGFFFWSFWDGATWIQDGTKSNFFQQNWTANPSLDIFIDLVFNQWWTNESLSTAADGQIDTRVFKGTYEVSYEENGKIVRDTILITDDMDLEIVANNISTGLDNLIINNNLARIFPNPADNYLDIEKSTNEPVTIQLFNIAGKMVVEQISNNTKTTLATNHLKGVYILKIFDTNHITTKKITIQ